MQKTKTLQVLYFLFTLPLLASADSVPQPQPLPLSPPVNYSLLPPDALALLEFKSKADLYNHLPFISHKHYDYCYWLGVKCAQGRVVGIILQRLHLGGSFEPDTLTRLDQLRVLTLQNTSLTGPIPDLSQLTNLKVLFLNRNSFSGNIPLSIATLHRLAILDISHNNLTGPIPTELIRLDRIYSLHFELNQLNGTIPPFNQSLLQVFNVSGNNLTGTIPVTPTLSKFNWTSFSLNPGLCGEIIGRNCGSKLPFFNPAEHAWPPGGNQQVHVFTLPKKTLDRGKKPLVILGFTVATLITIGFITAWMIARRKRKKKTRKAIVVDIEEENETRKAEVRKSGNLIFCAGEAQDYNVEELMRGSAEMLGRGTIGTTYKAVLDNQVVVCVKRLDVGKNAVTSGEMFERHVEMIGRLRHPNLVPLRAYFQAKQERLLIYDYQSNGSIFSLVHGLRSTRAKPLHWTSCLKIAEDIAQGLAHIHQIPNLVHGNLKATNVLLGADFEARLTDYCLTVLTRKFHAEDADEAGYAAPEILNFIAQGPCFTTKSDVYSFGVLLMELLTSKPPSQHPYLVSRDVLNWVRQVREEECSGEDNRLEMLVNLASTCSRTSPELRPTIWQVLEMIQEIKEIVTRESDSSTTFFF